MSTVSPLKISRRGSEGLEITWSDDKIIFLESRYLRDNCPSATSRAKRGDTSHDKPLSGGKGRLQVVKFEEAESINLSKIWSVGNYALGIEWDDGHNSGIYTYSFLRELSENTEAWKLENHV